MRKIECRARRGLSDFAQASGRASAGVDVISLVIQRHHSAPLLVRMRFVGRPEPSAGKRFKYFRVRSAFEGR
jgi:hypothetical protein